MECSNESEGECVVSLYDQCLNSVIDGLDFEILGTRNVSEERTNIGFPSKTIHARTTDRQSSVFELIHKQDLQITGMRVQNRLITEHLLTPQLMTKCQCQSIQGWTRFGFH